MAADFLDVRSIYINVILKPSLITVVLNFEVADIDFQFVNKMQFYLKWIVLTCLLSSH